MIIKKESNPLEQDTDGWVEIEQVPVYREEYWPRIKQRIADPNNTARFTVPCSICLDTLFDSARPFDTPQGQNGPHITACGHVFCLPCLEQHWWAQGEQELFRTCPMCRHVLQCKTCDQEVRIFKAPLWRPAAEWLHLRTSQTLPEGGTQLEHCIECSVHQEWFTTLSTYSPVHESFYSMPVDGQIRVIGSKVMLLAACLAQVEGIQTYNVRELFDVLYTYTVDVLEADETEKSKRKHYREMGRSTGEWMRVGSRKRRRVGEPEDDEYSR